MSIPALSSPLPGPRPGNTRPTVTRATDTRPLGPSFLLPRRLPDPPAGRPPLPETRPERGSLWETPTRAIILPRTGAGGGTAGARHRTMRPFETFEHSADIGLVARGRTLAELLANAADGLVDLTVDRDGLGDATQVQVNVSAPDRESLLVAWLNELLFLLDTDRFVPRRAEITAVDDTSLAARLSGDTLDPARHRVRRMIKAATYHGLSLREVDGVWEARVILDL